MNVTEIPFDTEQMIAGLRLWVESESPTTDSKAVNKIVDLASYDLATMGAVIERIPGRMGYADSLRACINPAGNFNDRFNQGRSNQPGILICGHADTVHEIGSLASMPYRRDGNYLWGPGIAAMKAGLYISLVAVQQLIRLDHRLNLPVTFLIVSDKELGCPSTRELIEATARQSKYVLVPGTARDAQTVYSGRYAEQRYKLDVKVDSVPESYSESAISLMARHIVDIDKMSTEGCRFKVGAIKSGQWVNFAEKCTAEVISEAVTEADVAESYKKIMALNSPNPDKGLHVNRSVSLPLWQSDQGECNDGQSDNNSLLSYACQVAEVQGLTLNAVTGASGSLANISGGMGIKTLDGLGVIGVGMQSRAERIQIDSLVSRAQMMAGLLTTLS